jgi:hypothetical protein
LLTIEAAALRAREIGVTAERLILSLPGTLPKT